MEVLPIYSRSLLTITQTKKKEKKSMPTLGATKYGSCSSGIALNNGLGLSTLLKKGVCREINSVPIVSNFFSPTLGATIDLTHQALYQRVVRFYPNYSKREFVEK